MKELICINCPLGCKLDVMEDGDEIKVTGNRCKRGGEYAISELRNPTRVVTSTIRVCGGLMPLVSVKTKGEVPKGLIFEVMKVLSSISVEAPVKIGDVIVKDILGTGIDIVATSNVLKSK